MGEHEEEAVEYMKEKNHEGMIYGIIKRSQVLICV